MKHKFVEALRRFLQKTVLPFKHKKEAFLSRIRLSLTLRISFNYLKLLLLNGVLFFGVLAVLYIAQQKKSYTEAAEDVVVNLEMSNGKLSPDTDLYRHKKLAFLIEEAESGKILYDDTTFNEEGRHLFFGNFYLDLFGRKERLIITETMDALLDGVPCVIHFEYDMTAVLEEMVPFLLEAMLVYLILLFFVILESKDDNEKILQPIEDMSETAAQLTINNIHSERLNIEGTKNELKDLAVVFNDMLDRLETSYESQKQFVSDASHELRTPIAVIQGYIGMLNRWGTSDEAVLKESIEAIQNEAKSMQDLVEKLLFLSRHDKKTLKLEKERFDMQPVVEEMVKETELVAKNRVIECPALEHVMVYGDKQALKQAIRVFIDNAVKYSEDGDSIRISCKNIQGDCEVTVEDTGIGMTKKDLDHIFNRFYRSDTVRDKRIEGHGLGLSIAKLIILGHAGRIKIRTQYTKGTSFIVTIPKRRF